MSKLVFVLDCDGTITDGKMWYNKAGKYLKSFGCDDFDLLRVLKNKNIIIHFITADKKGYEIIDKRINQECGFLLDLVSNLPQQRWDFIESNYPKDQYTVNFMGDGWGDHLCLKNANLSFTVQDALDKVKEAADIVLDRKGGDRAVAIACLKLMNYYGIEWDWLTI